MKKKQIRRHEDQMEQRPLVKPPEAAEYLGKTVQALAVWRSRGLGPEYIKIGRQVRYTEQALENFTTAGEVSTKGPSA